MSDGIRYFPFSPHKFSLSFWAPRISLKSASAEMKNNIDVTIVEYINISVFSLSVWSIATYPKYKIANAIKINTTLTSEQAASHAQLTLKYFINKNYFIINLNISNFRYQFHIDGCSYSSTTIYFIMIFVTVLSMIYKWKYTRSGTSGFIARIRITHIKHTHK